MKLQISAGYIYVYVCVCVCVCVLPTDRLLLLPLLLLLLLLPLLLLLHHCFLNVLLLWFDVLGPPITSTSEQKASALIAKQNGSELANGPFIMTTLTMSTYSQQLWVIAKVTTGNKDGEKINILCRI